MSAGLTKRQAEAVGFIREFIASNGYSPSYDEIGRALGISARSGAHRIVQELVARGAVTILKNRTRSIRVLEAA
jgi:repressor LexA